MSVLVALICLAANAVHADTMVNVTSLASQGANDTVNWSQLGADQTLLTASFGATSTGGLGITVSLAGPNSIVSVDCVATPCSWEGGAALTAGDSLIWASDNGNSGNGPVTFTFAQAVSGAGAFVQANAPGQFTVQIQAFNGTTLLGTFSEASDASGDAMYIGLQDATGANITSVTFSLTACGPEDSSGCADFAVDTLNLNDVITKQSTTTAVISSLNPSNFGQSVTFTATVTPATSGTPAGSVTFKNGATVLATKALSGGSATYSTSTLSPGSLSITAVYGGGTNFTGSTSPILTQTVNKDATSTSAIISSLNPSTYGQSVTYSATVTFTFGTPTGSVTFKDGTTSLGSATVNSSGVATITTTKTSAGTRSITAVYGGSTDNSSSTSPILTQTVNKDATTTSAVTSSLNPSTYGQSVIYSASVTSATGAIPSGAVAFKDGNATLGNVSLNGAGVATFSTTKTSAGTRSITAVYAGTLNFITSTSPILTQTVNQVATSTSAIISSLDPSTFGQSVSFSVTVTSTTLAIPTGTVTFKNGATTLASFGINTSGVAKYTTTTVPAGTDSITAVYSGNPNFIGSTSPALTQTVNQAGTTTAVTSSLNPSTFGASVTFTATVTPATSGTPSGNVTFKDGATTLATRSLTSGKATFSTTTLAKGGHTITVVYAGSSNYTGSTSPPLTQTVN
ncbi:MAG TPA: Ig-like domain-containing protein [Candidatus Acidoferrales bacterium]|nr:Ig-like domain-containing protein [Candidatus Acidoferrales bacterium]